MQRSLIIFNDPNQHFSHEVDQSYQKNRKKEVQVIVAARFGFLIVCSNTLNN